MKYWCRIFGLRTLKYSEPSSESQLKQFPCLVICSIIVVFVLFCFLDDSEAADLWLLNSCTVKNPSEDNFRNAIKRAQELDKHLVVAGCVPQGQPKHQSIKGISVIGVSSLKLYTS